MTNLEKWHIDLASGALKAMGSRLFLESNPGGTQSWEGQGPEVLQTLAMVLNY